MLGGEIRARAQDPSWSPPETPAGAVELAHDDLAERVPVDDVAQASRAALRARVVCADASDCPPWVGWLLYGTRSHLGGTEVVRCSAFLVGPDEVVTAGHCLHSVGLSPRHAVVVFPATGRFRAERVTVRASRFDETERNDSARLVLARRLARPPISVSALAPSYGAPVRIVSIQAFAWDARRSIVYGAVRVQRAQVGLLGSSCTLSIEGATVVPGYSGAPVVDERGRAVGIVRSFVPSRRSMATSTTCWIDRRRGSTR